VVAQRLIRKLCPDCKEAYEPDTEQLGNIKLKSDLIYRPKGCAKCNQIGYRGRSCIAETMVINERIRDLISQRASYQQIKEAAKQTGMYTLYEAAIRKVEDGVTSLEEALSATLGVE
jgi:type II secretory ATPase GspE/PulE/Tfp pilus assembly ATPase PilB-like protein